MSKNLKRIFLLRGPSEEPAGRADDGEVRRVAAQGGGAGIPIIMYFHVSMRIDACALSSASLSFLMPRYNIYTHSCVYSWVFPLSSAILVTFISLIDFCHIGLYLFA